VVINNEAPEFPALRCPHERHRAQELLSSLGVEFEVHHFNSERASLMTASPGNVFDASLLMVKEA